MVILQKIYFRIMCYLGFHDWTYSDPADPHKRWTRRCTKCGRVNEWLPGYGGSEIGCWNLEGTLIEQMTVINVIAPILIFGMIIYTFLNC